MTQPKVTLTEVDGALGILPTSSGRPLAVVGVSSQGPLNTPAAFARPADVVSTFGAGPLVEAAAFAIERSGRPVIVVRSEASVAGSYLDAVEGEDGSIGAITKTGTGSSVFTDNTSDPLVTANVVVLFPVGGTRGTAGIVYQISLDGGSTFGPPQALGTATTFGIGSTGASIAIGAGTVVAGDFISFALTGPIEASAGEVVYSGFQNAPTIDDATEPNDDYEILVRFVAGGTRGVSGCTYQYSLDGGRTMSATQALGTATSIIIPGSGGVKIDLGSGTIAAGASVAFPTVAPCWNNSDLATALDALAVTKISHDLIEIVGPCASTAFDVVDGKLISAAASGKYRAALMSTRMPIGDESEATYLASLSAEFGSKASTKIALCAGATKLTSSVSGRTYRRPAVFVAAAREASLSEEQNSAATILGPLGGVSIRDSLGNPDEHDESVNPGLDDARFYALRTHDDVEGVYVNIPRVFSATGSDFRLLAHRRVMNLASATIRRYLIDRCNKEIRVDKATGYILEEDAAEIEAGANAQLRSVLLAKPKASDARFTLSRTDNILSTLMLNGDARITPLAYPEQIVTTIGFRNPALQVTAV